jgi:hypothetical protein
MTDLEPIHRQELQLAPVQTIDIQSLLSTALSTPGGVDAIERIAALHEQMQQKAAKAAFDEALSAFQSECPVIQKEKGVPDRSGKIAYHYAPIEHIEVQIRPLLRKHGFSHTFDTDTASAQGWVIAKCIVTHRQGHSRTSEVKFPLGTKTGIMSDTQVYASALTFGNRRALQNAYGLVIAGEDMDGRGAAPKPAGPSALQPSRDDLKPFAVELWNLLTPVLDDDDRPKKNWLARNKWLWAKEILDGAIPEEAPALSRERFIEVIAAVKEVLR